MADWRRTGDPPAGRQGRVRDVIGDSGLAFLHQYWRSKKRGQVLPCRPDIDPTESPGKLWPSLMLLDVVGQGRAVRFRYRLVGTAFTNAFACDPAHEFVDGRGAAHARRLSRLHREDLPRSVVAEDGDLHREPVRPRRPAGAHDHQAAEPAAVERRRNAAARGLYGAEHGIPGDQAGGPGRRMPRAAGIKPGLRRRTAYVIFRAIPGKPP
jgi:hypothetical protein